MSFVAVFLALLLEQLKPLPGNNRVHAAAVDWVAWCGRNLDAGGLRHAWAVWGVSVGVPAFVTGALYLLVARQGSMLAVALDVALLYVTLGFRQFSHYFTDIREALERGDELAARQQLAQWRHVDTSDLPRTEVLRQVIEYSLLAAHRHVFGVFFWFIALSALGLGPMGAVLYRLAEFSSRFWTYRENRPDLAANPRLAHLARTLFAWMDHLPARLTAAGFAVVGNFEEAVAAWRRDAGLWREANDGVILAAAAGAVGVQLGGPAAPALHPGSGTERGPLFGAGAQGEPGAAGGSTSGVPARNAHLPSVVGLVWRSVVLWMLLLALLTAANVLG